MPIFAGGWDRRYSRLAWHSKQVQLFSSTLTFNPDASSRFDGQVDHLA
jgi:hypothetical protein